MIQVVINYDKNDEEYKLYNKDLDILLTSHEMFKVLVLFNSILVERFGENVNILKSDEIEYILDSASMKMMITSNVNLLKKLSKGPSAFQAAGDKYGLSSSSPQFLAKSKDIGEFDDMMKKRGKKFSNKFKK